MPTLSMLSKKKIDPKSSYTLPIKYFFFHILESLMIFYYFINCCVMISAQGVMYSSRN